MGRWVAWTLRHGRLLWLFAAMLAIPAILRTASMYANLESEVEVLLPPKAESLQAVQELRRRMPGLQFLGVIVDVGENASVDRMAGAERFVDALAARVATYSPDLVGGIRTGFSVERSFINRHGPLLMSTADLRSIRERIEDRLRYETAKKTGILLDEDERPPSLDFSDIEKRYSDHKSLSQLAGDRFSSLKLGVSLLLIEADGFSTNAAKARDLINRIASEIQQLGGPSAFVPGMTYGFTGDVAISAEETEALQEDLTLSSLLVIAAVMLSLWLYFRWAASLIALLLPLLLATGYAFALASLLGVRVLNSNTAFLGSIIVGNGINFGIIQLARYIEERRRGASVQDSLHRSLWGTRMGTLSAALAAGAAYASLMIMEFRGFRQFGVIGGLGMVLSWAATFVLGPPLIAWLDRREVFVDGRSGRSPKTSLTWRPMTAVGQFVWSHPKTILVVALLLTGISILKVRTFNDTQLEYDFSRMRRGDTWKTGEGYWGRKMDTLLGQYLTPTVLLADTPEEARLLVEKLRNAIQTAPLSNMVARVRHYDDFLPPDQNERMAEITGIRRKLGPALREDLTTLQQNRLDAFLGQSDPALISAKDIPEIFLKGMQERDGRADRAVLVYPKTTAGLWDGPRNAALVAALRQIAKATLEIGGKPARVAGGPPLTADIVASMRKDGPLASGLALVGVVFTVLLLFRFRLATPYVLGALLMGVLWMLALCMALRIKINFINFIAFPITFGIGVDYAVNIMNRYVSDGGKDIEGAILGTGAAVGLCSLTTIIGYSSLLVAKNLGLFSFGFLAVLGEITCLTVAVVVLPAALVKWRGQRSPRVHS